MEDGRHLKNAVSHVAASDEEMNAYRARLSQRLTAKSGRRRWSTLWVPAAAAAALVIFVFLPKQPFGPEPFDEFQTWIQQREDISALEQRARQELRQGHGTNRLNAMMVLCRLASGDEAMSLATRALNEERRPAFRAYYLELLLDHSDRYVFNPEFIEDLMERERDPVCLELMQGLLRLG